MREDNEADEGRPASPSPLRAFAGGVAGIYAWHAVDARFG